MCKIVSKKVWILKKDCIFVCFFFIFTIFNFIILISYNFLFSFFYFYMWFRKIDSFNYFWLLYWGIFALCYENWAVISGLLLYRGPVYQGFLTLEKPRKIWDLKVLSLISGEPLYPLPLGRGTTVHSNLYRNFIAYLILCFWFIYLGKRQDKIQSKFEDPKKRQKLWSL